VGTGIRLLSSLCVVKVQVSA